MAPPALKKASYWRIVLPLAIAETIIWAGIFYSFPALLLFWEADTGWSKTELTGAYTCALLTAAFASPRMGRLIDHNRGPTFLIGGSVLAVLLLIALSLVQTLWQFYLIWFGLGLCMAATLYEPCFAILIRHLGPAAKSAITRITLIAGFAGTVSFPTANFFAAQFGWRIALVVFALAISLITLPLAWSALRTLGRHHEVESETPSVGTGKRAPNRRAFWCLALAFLLATLNHGMILNHFLPLLAERGVALAFAVTAASLIGPMQVFGRLVMVATEKRSTTFGVAIFSFLSMIIAVLCLWFAGASPVMILLYVAAQGAPWGTLSIVRPALTRDVLGPVGFGFNSGRISGLSLLGAATAPFGGALIWEVAGYDAMLATGFVILCIAMALLYFGIRHTTYAGAQGD